MSAFQRLLPPRIFSRGPGLRVVLWSALTAILTGSLVVSAALLIDLLASGGSIATTRDQLKRVANDIPGLTVLGAPADLFNDDPPVNGPSGEDALAEDQDAEVYYLHDHGLIATLFRYEGRLLYRPLGELCSRFPLLGDSRFAVLVLLLASALLWLLRRCAQSGVQRAGTMLGMHAAANLRHSLHRQVLRLTPGDLDGSGKRSAVALFTETVGRVGDAIVHWVTRLPVESLTGLVLLVIALCIDLRLSLQCAIPVVIAWWMVSYEHGRLRQLRSLNESRAEADLRRLADGLRKSRLVRGYAMEEFEQQRFRKYLDRYTRELTQSRAGQWWSVWAARLCTVLCISLVAFFVSARVMSTPEPLPLSAGVLLLAVLARMTVGAQRLVALTEATRTLNVDGEKVFRYLNEIPEVGQAVGAKFLEPVSKSIILESVTYQLNARPLLKDLDLRLKSGTTTAVVSLDQAACRAIGYLLPRFIEPQKGRVLFDSEDTAWATLDSLRAETIYVGGDDPFFTGTVLENLTCGDSRFTVAEATDAAKLSHAHNFVLKLPQGYETAIGEHGEQLDPGQAFRLSLARAVLRNPAVLVIEEPAATLDDDTKALLDDAYNRVIKARTVLFLPRRLSTVRRCDQVALVQDGRVVAVGTHESLVKKSELYRHWEYVTYSTTPPPNDGG